MGADFDQEVRIGTKTVALWKHIQKATFPGVQGTPYLNHIAAKAVFFKETLSDEYRARQFKIIENAKRLAAKLLNLGFDVVTGGTDNHMVLVNVANFRQGLTGLTAQWCLEQCGIIVDMVSLPYDKKEPIVGSGIRLGTLIVTKNGMGVKEIENISALINTVLKRVEIISDNEYKIDESFSSDIRGSVKQLCNKFPCCI